MSRIVTLTAALLLTAGPALAQQQDPQPQTQTQTQPQPQQPVQAQPDFHTGGVGAQEAAVDAGLVRRVEAQLQQMGYEIAVNDQWDQETTDTLKQFQDDHRLPATGQLNRQTLAALNVEAEPSELAELPDDALEPGVLQGPAGPAATGEGGVGQGAERGLGTGVLTPQDGAD